MNAVSTQRRDFAYPTNRVVGTVGDADNARAAIGGLLQAGFALDDIDILHGEEDLRRFDAPGTTHGFLAQFQRTLIRTFELEEFKHLSHHVEDVRAGRFVIMVLAKRRLQRIVAADILNRYGADFVGFYGRWAWEALPGNPRTSPEDIPALFARAWNDRDADALASLFDEDGEFVSVTGLCWQGRESIRKAHVDRLRHSFDTTTFPGDSARIKLLSPDIAVVHARMTLSGQSGPRATIVSFVVHRTGERWQCASAHVTDVIAGLEAPVIDEAGLFRSAGEPGGPVS